MLGWAPDNSRNLFHLHPLSSRGKNGSRRLNDEGLSDLHYLAQVVEAWRRIYNRLKQDTKHYGMGFKRLCVR